MAKTNEYYTSEGEPIKCKHCGSDDIREDTAYEDNHPLYTDYSCSKCGMNIGFSAHGIFDISFREGLE
jgi:DNA-directed RNA polymerase subunit RPC12/RpoP